MRFRLALALFVGIFPLLFAACGGKRPPAPAAVNPDGGEANAERTSDGPLYVLRVVPPRRSYRSRIAADPVVIPECRLTVINKEDVPSQREGVILVIGTEVERSENVPPEKLIVIGQGNELRRFRRLDEDDAVEAGQMLAQLDDELVRHDLAIKVSKYAAAISDMLSSRGTRDEAENRFRTQLSLRSRIAATSLEEVRAAKLNWDRYYYETESKREAMKLAEHERDQANVILKQHKIRTSIPGIVKTIYKKRGEAVKAMEPVFQIYDLSRLRAEGMVDLEYRRRLEKGMTAVVEPSRVEGPEQTLLGHLQEVTAVAVSKNSRLIVSAGEDGSARVWERTARAELRVYTHPGLVQAVACTPPGSARDWCITGCVDGRIRLFDLERDDETPLREFGGGHKGSVTALAFSPDGKYCVTGGEDRAIMLWDVATGKLVYRFPAGHRATVTALQFTPQSRLVSAARDNTVRLWEVRKHAARLVTTIDRRSGDVVVPGVSPDGFGLLLDQGRELRILELPGKRTHAILENPGEAIAFTTFALFSPDGRLILTTGAGEGRLQLWRAPTETTRPYELRQFLARERSAATCAAFAPDGSFVVTGTKDRQVLVWSLPSRAEVEQQLAARLSLVEQVVESSARQAKVWADILNPMEPGRRLLPGTTVTLTVYPR